MAENITLVDQIIERTVQLFAQAVTEGRFDKAEGLVLVAFGVASETANDPGEGPP